MMRGLSTNDVEFRGGEMMTPAHFVWLILISSFCSLLCQSHAGEPSVATEGSTVRDELYWPGWRGPLGTGEGIQSNPPIVWSEEENIRWKVAIPGLGHSTPVIAGNRLFLTSAEPIGDAMAPRYSTAPGSHDNLPVTHRHQFLVICIDRSTGKRLWQTKVHEAVPHEGAHHSASFASASPTTDGKFVYAYFGSFGLYCLDNEGRIVWQYMPGKMLAKHGHGEGSSPALSGDIIAINWDHEGRSFVVAIDKATGEERWKKSRDEVTSWSSPIVVSHDGRQQLVIAGTSRVRGYDLESGTVLWECGGLSANIVATPVAGDGMVFVGSSYEIRAMMGIRLDGAVGDITGSDQVVWSRALRTPYVPSPLLYRGRLHFLRHYQGILSHIEAQSGLEPVKPMRLDAIRNVYASPVASNGHIYVTSLEGVTAVISATEIPRIVSVNRLDEAIYASAALAQDSIYLRGRKWLYAIGQ